MSAELADNMPRKGRKGDFSRSKHADHLTRAIVIIVTILALIYILLPVFWMIKSSFQTPLIFVLNRPSGFPVSLAFSLIRTWGWSSRSGATS